MEESINYQLTLSRRRRWVREAPVVNNDGPRIAFALFLAFLFMLYSSVAVIYKQHNMAGFADSHTSIAAGFHNEPGAWLKSILRFMAWASSCR
jgi:hypothetical protein